MKTNSNLELVTISLAA